jgi:hypothetical protein
MVHDGLGGIRALAGTPFKGCQTSPRCMMTGEQAQSEHDVGLIKLLQENYKNGLGPVIGGIVMAWVDEYWKGSDVQDGCNKACPVGDLQTCIANTIAGNSDYIVGGVGGCTWKSHISCENNDPFYQDLCGSWMGGGPDNYVNEQVKLNLILHRSYSIN